MCDASFIEPLRCLDRAFAAHDGGPPAALSETPATTTLIFNSTSVHALPTLLASVYDERLRNVRGGTTRSPHTVHLPEGRARCSADSVHRVWHI